MPNHLEFIVRPSQTSNIRPGVPTQIFAPQKVPQNNPITWGSSGDSVFDLRARDQSEIKPATWPEEQRKYDVVRVFNPDDRTQFVDTEQMTEYQGRNKISKDRIVIRFAKNQDTDNTEVISTGNIRKNSDGG